MSWLQHRRHLLSVGGLWAAFLFLATVTLLAWEDRGWFPPTGDEPHYLVLADAMLDHGSVEVSAAYREAFRERLLPGDPDSEPLSGRMHVWNRSRGLFVFHAPGLPAVVAMPYAAGGVIAAKLVLVLLNSLLVPLAWLATGAFTSSIRTRIVATVACCLCAPFLQFAGQIYPDMLAGVIGLSASALVMTRGWFAPDCTHRWDWMTATSVGLLPVLHLKFGVLGAWLLLPLVGLVLRDMWSWSRGRRSFPWRLLAGLSPFALGCALAGLYNWHAYGDVKGPYQGNGVVLDPQAIAVFLGLHLDRQQGFVMLNAAFILGVFWCVTFLRDYRFRGALGLCAGYTILTLNAFHPNWYGGDSFAGRFGIPFLLTALPLFLHGVIRSWESGAIGRSLVCVLIATNLGAWWQTLVARFPLLSVRSGDPPSLSPLPDDYLPRFFWWGPELLNAPNLVWPLFVLGLVFVGSLAKARRFRGTVVLVCLAAVACVAGVAAGHGSLADRWQWEGRQLHSKLEARSDREGWVETRETGLFTVGPYIRLRPGTYRFELEVSAESDFGAGVEMGRVDVFVTNHQRQLTQESYLSSVARQVIVGEFELSPQLRNALVEVRTFVELGALSGRRSSSIFRDGLEGGDLAAWGEDAGHSRSAAPGHRVRIHRLRLFRLST